MRLVLKQLVPRQKTLLGQFEAVVTVLESARLTEDPRRTGAGHLDGIRAAIDGDASLASVDTITVPELFARAPGPRVVSLIANMLADELDTASD